jgi:hypothetical protein
MVTQVFDDAIDLAQTHGDAGTSFTLRGPRDVLQRPRDPARRAVVASS